MNRFYYKKIDDNWDKILQLYLRENWSTHKIARVLFKNEKDYFWRIYRRLESEGIRKDIKDKMSFIRGYKGSSDNKQK